MNVADVRRGQRVRINVPGLGDHGQVGTIIRVRDIRCFVHVDWDQRLRRSVMFYAADLERMPDDLSIRAGDRSAELIT